jgi:hypothetical protein
MVKPPDAEPVKAARTFVAIASETSGPPAIESTQSRTIANAGSAATTAPNPTRLATAKIGSTAAFAPASMLARRSGRRCQLITMSVALAAASATATDHTPATAASDVPPQRSSARNEKSRRDKMKIDISRLNATTTKRGRIAMPTDGVVSACFPCAISAGSNSCAAVARSRMN